MRCRNCGRDGDGHAGEAEVADGGPACGAIAMSAGDGPGGGAHAACRCPCRGWGAE